jgi:pimeloyl-ACP methyl ester carboxylesterase
MAFIHANGVRLFYESTGEGEPLVLAHGSWGDHHNWDLVVPELAKRFRVITYDRRGHSDSERPATQGSFDEDADDLAAVIEGLGVAPAYVVGNSGGSIIALKCASRHPEVMRALVVHEPPAVKLLDGRPEFAEALAGFDSRIKPVAELLSRQQWEEAAKLFANTIAIGPDAWDTTMTPEFRATFVRNAPTFWDELHDADGLNVDLDRLAVFPRPILLTAGNASAPFFAAVAETIATAVPAVSYELLDGADHVPHISTPDSYLERVFGFLASRAVSA